MTEKFKSQLAMSALDILDGLNNASMPNLIFIYTLSRKLESLLSEVDWLSVGVVTNRFKAKSV